MSGKLRIVLGVLVLAAAGSVSYLLPSLSPGSPADKTATVNDALALNNGLGDTDKDGLTDRDEVYWRTDINNSDTDGDGFKDGEEVLTGHNPLVKGPDDFLDPTQNATKRITELAVGGLMAGDLDPNSSNYEASVKMLAEEMAAQYSRTITIPRDTLQIIADSDGAKTEYARTMSTAFLKIILPATKDTNAFFDTFSDIPIASRSWITDSPQRYMVFSKEARRLASVMQDRALKIVAIPVPKLFEPQHAGAVQMLRAQQRYYELLATFKEDPLLGSAALNGLLRLQYEGTRNLLYDFTSALSLKLIQ